MIAVVSRLMLDLLVITLAANLLYPWNIEMKTVKPQKD